MIRSPRFWFGAFAIWVATLWWLSSDVRELPAPQDWVNVDKFYHFGFFLGGAGILASAVYWHRGDWPFRRRFWIVVGIVALVGGLDELHQSFVEGRSGNDPFDFAADFLGACAGTWLFEVLRPKIFRRRSVPAPTT
ncbi:VanZ family protein [Haloferula luteola]|uniref:VanZ family protein n=1 Tax=Haloferula luteola TaxID=595692 RepID=A0A840V7T8_9BACT|nr:VanZ family protein [Haloferula luteola]MBB5350020.1 VanZ family protein [Haloferula luteola]